jgi:hypothetical protein
MSPAIIIIIIGLFTRGFGHFLRGISAFQTPSIAERDVRRHRNQQKKEKEKGTKNESLTHEILRVSVSPDNHHRLITPWLCKVVS